MNRFKFRCAACGDGRRAIYWSDEKRERLLARCAICGANFNGPGVWLPLEWATNSARGLLIELDPHRGHGHGHSRCPGIEQGVLL